MLLKRLKLHQFFSGVARTCWYTQVWVLEGAHKFENFSRKAVFLASSGKKQN